MKNEKHTCCLCGKKFSGLGNNAQPFAKSDEPPHVGAKVLIVDMEGEPRYSGRYGIIEHIDDIGQLHGTWGGCALVPSIDKFIIVKNQESENK